MRLGRRTQAVVAGLALAAAGAAEAQQAHDPDWPCVQRKVPELAMGQMWSGPIPEGDAATDDAVEELARTLAPRRVTVEAIGAEAQAAVRDLPPEARAERLGELFAELLDRINAERGEIIAGIGRYARRQAELADRIEAMQLELGNLEAAPEAEKDRDRIEELRERLAWDARVFKERSQSLTFVCETPVLLEQRAFAIARTLAALI
jgi:hypothetical protein